MASKFSVRNIFRSIVSNVARAGQSFGVVVSEFRAALKFGLERASEATKAVWERSDKFFRSEAFRKEVKTYSETLEYLRSREQMPRLNVKDLIPDALKIRTVAVLKGKYQYLFDFQGTYPDRFIRPSEMVSLLSDTELTQEQAYEEMYRKLQDKRVTTAIQLTDIDELTFVGVRTQSEI